MFVFRDIVLLQKKIIVIFQENIISRRITTQTSVNGIFYMVVERVEHYFDICSGQLIGVNSGAPEVLAVPGPLVTPVVLLSNDTNIM